MPEVYRKEHFSCTRSQLWDIITALYDCSWRKDIARIQTAKDGVFYELTEEKTAYKTGEKRSIKFQPAVEYSTAYSAMKFTTVSKELHRHINVIFENERVEGSIALTLSDENEGCALEINGSISGRKLAMKPVAKTYLVNRLNAYAANLHTAAMHPAQDTPDKMTPRELIAEARRELEKTSLYNEGRHLYIIWNLFSREWIDRSMIPQIEVAGGEARIFMYRISGHDDETLREIAFEKRTKDYREVVFVIADLVLSTAAAECRSEDNSADAALLKKAAFAEIGGCYQQMNAEGKTFLNN